MTDNLNGRGPDRGFKEAVCIDAGRVYDSCCDRDCLEDIRCYFNEAGQAVIDTARSVRLKDAEVLNVAITVEPVNLNRGFYSCELTFYFRLNFDVYTAPHTCPTPLVGACCFTKKVILFGSEGNVKVFANSMGETDPATCDPIVQTGSNVPRCVVQCVDPVCLSARIGEVRECYENCCIPDPITEYIGGPLVTNAEIETPTIYVTLGLFTIIQLIRNVQMLVPVYDYCIPEKQCDDTADQPCEVFRRIKFPTNDFFPPKPDKFCGKE